MMEHQWTLSRGRLEFAHSRLTLFWEVPDDFKMPSPALLDLVEYLLLSPFEQLVDLERERPFGRRCAIAYSGGVDSTAAVKLLPEPIPIYTEVANPTRLHKIENALLALTEIGGGIKVRSNYDELAEAFGRNRGFYGPGGFTIPSVLFADYCDLGIVSDGNVLETIYLHSSDGHGTRYKPKNLSKTIARFARAGLHYSLPCAGLSEVGTTRIAAGYRFAMGCMRGVGGEPCNNCAKCYRKRALQGDPIPPCRESELKINKAIVPMLPSLLWAVRNKGLRHPLLDNLDKNIDWVDKWYADAAKYLPEVIRGHVMRKIDAFGIQPLEDDMGIRNWTSSRM